MTDDDKPDVEPDAEPKVDPPLVLSADGAGDNASSTGEPPTKQAKPAAEVKLLKRPFWVTWRWETANGISTVVIAIATIVAVLVSYIQWIEVRRTVEVANRQADIAAESMKVGREMSEAITRGYLVADESGEDENGPPFSTVLIRWKNVGQTPAYVTGWKLDYVTTDIGDAGIKAFFDIKLEDTGNEAIGTGAFNDYSTEFPPLSADQLKRYRQNKLAVRTIAVIEYKDIYGKPHRTTHCRYRTQEIDGANYRVTCDEWIMHQ